ncbi:MAG: hypothetical protein SOR11_04815 [Fusobacterium sp.]|uniref:hypothetical protein n=1 Tax=Fusobacterium sp. TaxID=68766 RepID=UPI002A74751C|nr:hypothetical protein [Fusobacterium sp.]MDY3059305.1 hypothetical protein [Fusobacterium sp.]
MKLLTNDEILEILEGTIRNLIPYAIITLDAKEAPGGVILTNKEIKDLYNEIRKNKYENTENDLILEIVEFKGIENSKYWGVNKNDSRRV